MSRSTASLILRAIFLGETQPFRRMPKPELSRSVLLATTFVVSLGLLVWLLLFIVIRHGGPMGGYWVAQQGVASPVLPFQASDLARILNRTPGNLPAAVASWDLKALLREHRVLAGGGPMVVYLSAAGVSDGRRPLLLATNHLPVDTSGDANRAGLSADELLDVVSESSSKGAKCLLILDAGQIGTDRNLGVFGNGFVHRLATLMKEKKPKGLSILCSCAPGQVSWTSEADGRSVFGHFVARGLAGEAAGWDPSSRGLSARGLAEYVRHHVARWVSEKRRAQQTPILLSADDAEDFPLRPSVYPWALRADTMDATATEDVLKRLAEGWARRDELETRRPFRHAPLLWRRYQEALLRAERLTRAGQHAEAARILGELVDLERRLTERLDRIALGEPLSIALAEAAWAAVPPGDRQRAVGYRATIAEALSELTGGAGSRSAGPKSGSDRKVPEGRPMPAEASPGANPAKPAPEPATGEPSVPTTTAGKREPAVTKKAESSEAESDAVANVPARRGASPLARLRMSSDDEGPPAYLEGQLLVWAGTFQQLGASHQFGSPDFFAGRRAQSLRELVDLRTAAEIAAAGDERVRHRIAPLVAVGDAIRRKAQDRLFAGGPAEGEGPTSHRGDSTPRRARELYDQARRAADLFSNALDLVQRLESELPYLGEWLARRNARLGVDGLGEDLETLLDDAAGLVDLIIVDPGSADEGQSSPSAADEVLGALASRVKAVKERFDRAGAAYDRLEGLLLTQCRKEVDAEGPEHWREADDLLSVPTVPAELRLRLFQKVRGVSASSLDGSTPTERPAGLKAGAARRGGLDPGPGRGEDPEDGADAPSSSADPFFWGHALGMARLEWGLLKIGGAPAGDLSRLEGAYRAAKKSFGGGTAAAAFDAFDELSAVIRAAHGGQIARVEEVRALPWPATGLSDVAIHRQFADAGRASRVLPLAYAARSLDDHDADRLDRFHRYAFLLWHGRRLLEDFAVDHAQLILDRARLASDGAGRATTLALKDALDDAEARKSARLVVEAQPADRLAILDWGDHPLRSLVNAVGKVPPGDASALIGASSTIPVAVAAAGSRRDAREGTLVSVSPGTPPQPAEFLVARVEATGEARTFGLTPGAFYRGRFFPADRDLTVTTDGSSELVAVTIHQSYRRVSKRIADQFRRHPGKGFLHPGGYLDYLLKVESKTGKPMNVRVKYGLEGQSEPEREVPLELTASKPVGEITDTIVADDIPVDRPRNLIVTVMKEGGVKPVSKRVFPFRQVLPNDYISVVPSLRPDEGMLYLDVKRLQGDSIDDLVPILVRVGEQSATHMFHQRGEVKTFSFPVSVQGGPVAWSVHVEGTNAVIRGEVSPNDPTATPKSQR